MPELPASVRLALWATAALAGRIDVEEVATRATPDLPDVDGAPVAGLLGLWADLGERVVHVSLPSPGDLVGLPRGGTGFVGAALDAGECAWSPLIGRALVPELETFGPAGDEGTLVRWVRHDCSPPAPHLVVPPAPADLERELREGLAEAVDALDGLDVPSWDAGLRELADERVSSGRWGLPDGLGVRVRRVLTQAAVVETIATTALGHLHDAPTLRAGADRDRILRELARLGRRALASSTCAAAQELAR